MPVVRPSGGPSEPEPPPAPAPQPPAPARPRSRKGWWLAGGLVMTLALLGGLVVAYRATTEATVPAREIPPVAIPAEVFATPTPSPAPAPSGFASAAVAAPVSSVPSPSRTVSAFPSSAGATPKVTGRANPAGVNLALTAAVTASSSEGPGWPPGDACDGDPSSRWSSGFAEPQWIRIDLRQRRELRDVTLVWEHAHAVGYRIDVSLDGRTWRTIWSTSAGKGGTVRVDAAGETARFVRMYGTKRSNQYGFSLYELEVH